MTLVPNLPRPSNGSKFFFLLLIIVSFSACDLFKKLEVDDKDRYDEEEVLGDIQGKKVYDPETGTYIYVSDNVLTAKMDTIIWKEVPLNPNQVISSEGAFVDVGDRVEVLRVNDIGSEFLSSYNVAIMLPFLSQRFDSTSEEVYKNSTMALNFYGGARMALDDLGSEGKKFTASVFDSKASEAVVSSLLRTNADVSSANLIIGPFKSENVRLVANYVQGSNKAFVSPYSASSNITSRNPNYIQVSPTLKTHCEAITQHARQNFRPDQIVIVARDRRGERESLPFFQEENYKIMGERNEDMQLREYIIADDENFDEIDMLPLLELQDTTVFIIPSWQEPFVYSLLRKIELARNQFSHIVVYGMPQWANFELIDFEYYEKVECSHQQ
jgi:hypothetical protein